MDLIYKNLTKEEEQAIKSIGSTIEDASDYIHTERVSVHYPSDKKAEYLAIINKLELNEFSMTAMLN